MVQHGELTRLMHDFGSRLRALRIVAGYKDAEAFAADLGVKAPAYRKYERGDAWPPLDVLVHMCDLLDTSMDFLLRGKKK